ncbi:hypothetical protein ACQP00_28030 [Dactylosporangium sp. CS-047395]|uniref:hypothetical protein n=1 Tax=Dactylosporangium sp. CS-047395 TaxID=3239936 RepID=UPI003D8EEA30
MTTVRFTVSLPEDVAAPLKDLPPGQVSAYVAEALRRRQALERTQEALTRAGHRQFEPDPADAAALREELRVPVDVRDETIARLKADGILPAGWQPYQ